MENKEYTPWDTSLANWWSTLKQDDFLLLQDWREVEWCLQLCSMPMLMSNERMIRSYPWREWCDGVCGGKGNWTLRMPMLMSNPSTRRVRSSLRRSSLILSKSISSLICLSWTSQRRCTRNWLECRRSTISAILLSACNIRIHASVIHIVYIENLSIKITWELLCQCVSNHPLWFIIRTKMKSRIMASV